MSTFLFTPFQLAVEVSLRWTLLYYYSPRGNLLNNCCRAETSTPATREPAAAMEGSVDKSESLNVGEVDAVKKDPEVPDNQPCQTPAGEEEVLASTSAQEQMDAS